jgi:hypothetical protein
MSTPHRPNVRGLKYPEYDHVGTPDLRNWLGYWEAVAAGTRRPNAGDTVAEARGEVAKLTSEIEAREAAGFAGPGRDASW